MSKDFISTEVDKIMNSTEFEFPLNLSMACAWILGNFKGTDLKVFNVAKQTAIADYFVLASSQNATQSLAMADEISRLAHRYEIKIISQEGRDGSDWVLVDLGSTIVHIFDETAREKYALDNLWNKAAQVKIPDSYYFAHPEMEKTEPQGNYF